MDRKAQDALDTFYGHIVAMSEKYVEPCAVCGAATVGQACLQDHVRRAADKWNSIMAFQEQFTLPAELCAAFGLLDDIDCYRASGRSIPESRVAETLQALQVIERNKVTA